MFCGMRFAANFSCQDPVLKFPNSLFAHISLISYHPASQQQSDHTSCLIFAHLLRYNSTLPFTVIHIFFAS
jgi:hypothetical protein